MTRLKDRQILARDTEYACADGVRLAPSCTLADIDAEQAQIIGVANEPHLAETLPTRIVPALADERMYIASESSFHCVLRAHGQINSWERAQPLRTSCHQRRTSPLVPATSSTTVAFSVSDESALR